MLFPWTKCWIHCQKYNSNSNRWTKIQTKTHTHTYPTPLCTENLNNALVEIIDCKQWEFCGFCTCYPNVEHSYRSEKEKEKEKNTSMIINHSMIQVVCDIALFVIRMNYIFYYFHECIWIYIQIFEFEIIMHTPWIVLHIQLQICRKKTWKFIQA